MIVTIKLTSFVELFLSAFLYVLATTTIVALPIILVFLFGRRHFISGFDGRAPK